MAKLIKELTVSCSLTRSIRIVSSPSVEIRHDKDALKILFDQGFLLYRNLVTFSNMSDLGIYWVRILTSDELRVDVNIRKAIVLPYEVRKSGNLFLYCETLNYYEPFSIEKGKYNLLYETRFLTEDEVASIPEYAEDFLPADNYTEFPELIQFTFVPTKRLPKPKYLIGRRTNPDSELVIFNEEKTYKTQRR